MPCQLVLVKQVRKQKQPSNRAVAQKPSSACLGLRFAGWQLCAVACGDTETTGDVPRICRKSYYPVPVFPIPRAFYLISVSLEMTRN